MSEERNNLLTEMFRTTKFYYFNVLPALVRCANFYGNKKTYQKEIEINIDPFYTSTFLK